MMSRTATGLPGQETLLASWDALARLSPGARLVHSAAATAAVFPSWVPLNNAILLNGNETAAASAAIELMGVYAGAGVDAWALWVPSAATNLDDPDAVQRVGGFRRDTTTLVMQAQPVAGAPVARRRRSHVDRGRGPRRRRTGSLHRPRGAGHGTRPGGLGDGARRGGGGRRLELPAREGLRDLRGRHGAGMAASGPGAEPGGTRACRCTPAWRANRDAAIDANGAAALSIPWF